MEKMSQPDPQTSRITPQSRVVIPALVHPLFRTEYAIQRGVEKKLLFRTWGGIGDVICAEPTVRYAINNFKDCEISLATDFPEIFQHLKFKRVFNLKKENPNYDDFYVMDTITPPDESNMVWLFFSHMLTNCVDFPSMCALRLQLPIEDKEIMLRPTMPTQGNHLLSALEDGIVVHPGKHWQSKTFPSAFWNIVLSTIISKGLRPILIGADIDDNRGTVAVNVEGCLDLRNLLSINDSIWLLQHASVLLTNDSSPLHMAASGNAWIGYIATCKHPDHISHWRNGKWNWREVNFGQGGIWELVDFCPNKKEKLEADVVPQGVLESWLPSPVDYAEWAVRKHLNEKTQAI